MLTIHTDDSGLKSLAQNVFYEMRDKLPRTNRGEASMGAFVVSKALGNTATGLMTEGAETCVIIVVHMKNGTGALGHFSANPDPQAIVRGVKNMVKALGAKTDVAAVVFAAGSTSGDPTSYRSAIVNGTRQMCQNAQVSWPDPGEYPYSACVYLPQQGKAALFHGLPSALSGSPSPIDELTDHAFAE